MALLKDKDREHLIKEFEALKVPVKLVVFTQENEEVGADFPNCPFQ